jgi:hypothetical protein
MIPSRMVPDVGCCISLPPWDTRPWLGRETTLDRRRSRPRAREGCRHEPFASARPAIPPTESLRGLLRRNGVPGRLFRRNRPTQLLMRRASTPSRAHAPSRGERRARRRVKAVARAGARKGSTPPMPLTILYKRQPIRRRGPHVLSLTRSPTRVGSQVGRGVYTVTPGRYFAIRIFRRAGIGCACVILGVCSHRTIVPTDESRNQKVGRENIFWKRPMDGKFAQHRGSTSRGGTQTMRVMRSQFAHLT